MAKTQQIKRRIRSVKSIHQITNAMELVAASKLRRAQEAALALKRYAVGLEELMQHVSSTATYAAYSRPRQGSRHVLVLYTSDRGLAGAYNTNLFRRLLQEAAQLPAGEKLEVIVIGNKGAAFLIRVRAALEVIAVYSKWPSLPTVHEVRPLARSVRELFEDETVADVRILYTEFHSALRQEVVRKQLLPLPMMMSEPEKRDDTLAIEPSADEFMAALVPRLLEVQLWRAGLEAWASEEAMRMLAMHNASQNADDLMEDLTLAFNNARQAAITQELAEISAGAEAII